MVNNNKSVPPYDVGYGKPPKAHQFRKGTTGNPRGRKRGDENLIAVFKQHVLTPVKIRFGDTVRTVSLAEAVILKNYDAALQKNAFAMSNIFRLAEDSGEFIDQANMKQVGAPIAVPAKVATMEDFLAEFGRKIEDE